jgi:ribosome-associated heat shock protein Hsp15
MRVDKYLWAIRVFKTRTLASKHCKAGKVSIDGEQVKPSRDLKLKEKIDVRKGAVTFSFKVIDFPKNRVGAKLVEQFGIACTDPDELAKLEMIQLSRKQQRWKGLGRPTKKDRRDIDNFLK